MCFYVAEINIYICACIEMCVYRDVCAYRVVCVCVCVCRDVCVYVCVRASVCISVCEHNFECNFPFVASLRLLSPRFFHVINVATRLLDREAELR